MITYPLNKIEYQATDAELFHVTRTSGVYAGDHFGYSITGTDNNITIDIGIAWIKNGFFSGKVAANPKPEIIDCGIADASLPRWDIICVQFDKNKNATAIVVKKGTPASSPIVPAVEQAETIFELCLYRIYRPAGSVAIVPENIYDTRLDPDVCGLMADSVTYVDTDAINAQVTALIRKLNQAITDTAAGVGEVNEYIQSGDVDNLILDGVGTNGKFKSLVDGTVTTATVNSETYTVNAGSENEIELASNSWYLFVLDTERKTINFNQGGAGLNFKVVGGTAQPASPKENTIWVNTDMSIPKWDISISRPEAGVAGQVWLVTGAESDISFNTLKKNGVFVKIIAAQQWNGTEWISVEVKGYINGSWKDSDIYIFSATNGINRGTWAKSTDGILTVSEDMVLVSAKVSEYGRAVCSEGIDVTNLNKLIFNVNEYYRNDSEANSNLVGLHSQTDASLAQFTSSVTVTKTGEYVIDISGLSGVYYPKIQVQSKYNSSGAKTRIGVNEIKFTY